MTFNVRGSYFPDGENAWERRSALNIETIRRAAPDLIGFQETHTGNLKAYAAALTRYWWTAWPEYNDQPPHQWPSIFWDPERLRPLESSGFWLSETPECFSGSWDTDCIRSAAWVQFRCLRTGALLVHLNTHIDHISEQARIEGTRLIIERLAQLQEDGAAAVVTGDFNTPVGSQVYEQYASAGFRDAWLESNNDDDPRRSFTYHGWQGESFRGSDAPPRRIDWILMRDGDATLRATTCTIVRDAQPPVYPSDHYPVVADLLVTARRPGR